MLKVLMANGESVTFPDGAEPDVNDQTGRLYVSINGYDVAVFADGGWLMYGRPAPEDLEPADQPVSFEDEYGDDEDGDL